MTQQNIGTVTGAKSVVVAMIDNDLRQIGRSEQFDASSPDPRDLGKFMLAGRPGRIVHARDGFYAPINLGWLTGGRELPEVWRFPFHWYAFVVPRGKGFSKQHYFLCDYMEMRSWVLDFAAPQGNDHADHNMWRGMFEYVNEGITATEAYFRWGDETPGDHSSGSRLVALNNVVEILARTLGQPIAPLLPPGESTDPAEPLESSDDDPEELVLRLIRARRGQRRFRQNLIELYSGKCAITGHGPIDVLEAAHIQPHSESGRNSTDNGLLLRADIHTLFDLRLLWIEPDSHTVRIAPTLRNSPYSDLDGQQLRTRSDGSQPNNEYLSERSRST